MGLMLSSYVMLALMLGVMGVIACGAIIATMAVSLLRPPRMTDGKAVWVLRRLSPGDLGLGFVDVHFNVRDEETGEGLRIAGWWIAHPAAAGRCVVLLHGYADAKVGAIAWAPLWRALGFNVLAIDLHAHGESGGTYCTAGYWERHDIGQVLDAVRRERPHDASQIVLFGVSMGAAVAAATAEKREDLSAVILESPPADFRSAAMSHMDRLGAPGKLFQRAALALAQRIGRCDFSLVRPADTIKRILCPIMIIAPNSDPTVSEVDRMLLQQSLTSRGRENEDVFWEVNAGHLLAFHAEPQKYEQQVKSFMDRVLKNRPLRVFDRNGKTYEDDIAKIEITE